MDVSMDCYCVLISLVTGFTSGLLLVVAVLTTIAILLLLYRWYLIKQSRKKEYWLPIVNDKANVIGRVAQSISFEVPGTYQHPLVRIVTYKPGAIYLHPRTNELCPESGKYDHPFESLMEYGLSVDEVLRNLQTRYFPKSQLPKFLLRYRHINEKGRWQVLLFILRINDESELVGLDKNQGKFWTIPQIKANLKKKFFSTCFEGEFDFLRTIIQNG